MTTTFPKLFEPGRIGSLEIPNRVAKAPQSTGLSNIDGSVSERLIRHYRRLAQGGTGLIIVEYAYIDDIASKSAHCQLGISSNEHIAGLSWLADTIKEEGARAAIQIEHCGRQKFLGTPPIKSASAIPWPALYQRFGKLAVPEELTVEEIDAIIKAFGDAAERAVMAGFELIEIHGAHGYLITNFLSPHTNKRSDQYGGSLENRMRLLVEIVRNTRSKIGSGFPLTVRLSGTDYEPDGFPIEETIEVCRVLEREGIDAIHVSGGDHHQMIHQVTPMSLPRGHNVWAAEAIRKEISIPVFASGSITTPDLGEKILENDQADFVALGRPLWADPDWTMKAREGRPEDVRPCIRCNEGCLERTFFKNRAITCAVCPTTGREGELEITPAENRKRVAVVGGGPAGMEAARVCSLRGHEVTLFERRSLGGVLNEAAAPEFKYDLKLFLAYLKHQITNNGITIRHENVTPETLIDGAFDEIIVATGAKPIHLDLPGIHQPFVHDALDVLADSVEIGERVVVVGGGMVGTEVAIELAENGKRVTIVEMLPRIMSDCATTDRIAYGQRLKELGVAIHVGDTLETISEGLVKLKGASGVPLKIFADSVVMAVGYAPDTELVEYLRQVSDLKVHDIGDCVRPGKIFDAIHSGYRVALRV